MAVPRNNDNNLFGSEDANDTGFSRMPTREGRRSIWSHARRLFGGGIDNADIFQSHAERMRRFCKSHVPNQDIGVACRSRVPVFYIDATASETGGSKGPIKARECLFLFPEWKVSPHGFSLN